MQSIFMKELQERFPDYRISPIGTTRHFNVLRLSKDGYPTLVAKTIWHDASDPGGDMGIKAQDDAYRTEVKILKMLPSWWGIRVVDNFKTTLNRVIVTNEVRNVPWNSYKKGIHDVKIAELLLKQIKWLHSHGIAHNDLELKNILLTESVTPVIIDFEKSNTVATKEQIKNDYSMLLGNMKEYPNTESIGVILQGMPKGGALSRTRRNKKTAKARAWFRKTCKTDRS
uniref:Protein kinase domain-containing protein n=1 Tax=viral metagenome TaxID=1070528 RepID=A0A6C0K7Y1_9ZZZZ